MRPTHYRDYESIDAVRWSSLKSLRISPLHYKARTSKPERDKPPHLQVGIAIHEFVLEPNTFLDRVVVYADGIRRGKAWDAFRDKHEDKLILSANEYERAVSAGGSVVGHPVASEYLQGGMKEMTIQWKDAATGISCKARADHAGAHLVDLKSTSNLDGRMFANAAVRYGYCGQLAFYLDGLKSNGIDVHDDPIMIAVESDAPFDVVVYRFTQEVVDYGREEYQTLLQKLRKCLDTDEWPGRSPGIQDFILPSWATFDDGMDIVLPDGEVLS